jgi:FkbM family methyltransferase
MQNRLIKNIIYKIQNKELKKYILWKFSLRSFIVLLKRIRFYFLNPKVLINDHHFFEAKSKHGKIIINLYDEQSRYIGVSSQIILNRIYEPDEVNLIKKILKKCEEFNGSGVIFIDCGANLGVFTLEASKLMKDWGKVYAFEPQKPIYDAMVQTLKLNNCINVETFNEALGSKDSFIKVPALDYSKNSNFGSLELDETSSTAILDNQKINLLNFYEVRLKKLDSINFKRVDFIKIDVEGMEEKILRGSNQLIEDYSPVLLFEHIKLNKTEIYDYLYNRNYIIKEIGPNSIAVNINSGMTIENFLN